MLMPHSSGGCKRFPPKHVISEFCIEADVLMELLWEGSLQEGSTWTDNLASVVQGADEEFKLLASAVVFQ